MKGGPKDYDPHGHREVAAFHSDTDASNGDQLEQMAAANWRHPHEEQEPEKPDGAFGGREPADIFRRLFAICMPTSKTSYRGARAWRAGLNRMVAIAYHVAPEQFLGMTQAQVAAELGITHRAFKKQLATVGRMLDTRPACGRRPRP